MRKRSPTIIYSYIYAFKFTRLLPKLIGQIKTQNVDNKNLSL